MMDGSRISPEWIAVDWGTSNLRAWAMDGEGNVLAEATSDRGMSSLAKDEFEPALRALVDPWLVKDTMPVVACGMVGARQGWTEAPYSETPCAPQASMVRAPSDAAIQVQLIGGVCQKSPPDVMRGEETQIAGFLRLNPDFDGVVCLPGTHTKWAHISAGEIVSFQSFMTGEVFALLSDQSVLRHSIDDSWDDPAFDGALSDAISKPELLAARLFGIRAAELVADGSKETAGAKLSGYLIGAELAAARPYWLGQSVAIIGARSLAKCYRLALESQGVPVIETDAERMTLEGLKAAFAMEMSS